MCVKAEIHDQFFSSVLIFSQKSLTFDSKPIIFLKLDVLKRLSFIFAVLNFFESLKLNGSHFFSNLLLSVKRVSAIMKLGNVQIGISR